MLFLLPTVFPLLSRLARSSLASFFRRTSFTKNILCHEVTDDELQCFHEPPETLEALQEMNRGETTFVKAPENHKELSKIKIGKKELQRVRIELTEKSGDSCCHFNKKYFMSAGRYDEFKGRKKIISTHNYFKESNNDGGHDEIAVGNNPPILPPLSRLFEPHMHESLVKMLQKMPLKDLVRIMLTNKQLFEHLGSLRRLTKPIHLYRLEAGKRSDDAEEDMMGEGTRLEMVIYKTDAHPLYRQKLSDLEIQGLRYLPVSVCIEVVDWHIGNMWEEDMNTVIGLIESLPIRKIKEVTIDADIWSWAKIPKLMRDYKVEHFGMSELLTIPEMHVEEIFTVPTLTSFISAALVPQHLFVESKIRQLELDESTIDKKGTRIVINRWLDGMDIEVWGFGHGPSKVDLCAIFLDTLVLKHDFDGQLPCIRPLALVETRVRNDGAPITQFWLIRDDDRVLKIGLYESSLFLCLLKEGNYTEYPKSLLQL